MHDGGGSGTPGYGQRLVLLQLEYSLLDKETDRGFHAIAGTAMYPSELTRYYIP